MWSPLQDDFESETIDDVDDDNICVQDQKITNSFSRRLYGKLRTAKLMKKAPSDLKDLLEATLTEDHDGLERRTETRKAFKDTLGEVQLTLEEINLTDNYGIIFITEHLDRHQNDDSYINALASKMVNQLDDHNAFIFLRTFSSLVTTCFAERPAWASPARSRIRAAFKLLDCTCTEIFAQTIPDAFQLVNKCSNLDVHSLKLCYTHVLGLFVGRNSFSAPVYIADDLWEEKGSARFRLVQELLVPFDTEELVNMIARLLMRTISKDSNGGGLDWKNLGVVVLVMVTLFHDGGKALQEIMDEKVVQSLDEWNEPLFRASFFVIRAICHAKHHLKTESSCNRGPPGSGNFYSDWFHRSFGQEPVSLAARHRKFVPFINLLTKMVPEECRVFLTSHLSKPPYIPARHQQSWKDYVALARTRIVDLGKEREHNEDQWKLMSVTSDKNKSCKEASSEVLKALREFSNSGAQERVPRYVVEAHIFRRPYFVGQFLPALINFEEMTDVRDRLVAKLAAEGILPNNITRS